MCGQGCAAREDDPFFPPFIAGESYFSHILPEHESLAYTFGAVGPYQAALVAPDADKLPDAGSLGSSISLKGLHEKELRVCKTKDALFSKLKRLGPLHCPARYVKGMEDDRPCIGMVSMLFLYECYRIKIKASAVSERPNCQNT
jgi:hypothetical protein